MPLILNSEDVHQACDMAQIIKSVEDGINEQAQGFVEVPMRQNLTTSNGFFRVMPCVMTRAGKMGIKVFNGSVESGVRYIIMIYDEKTGELLSMMDAAYLTGVRTGATTGVATKYQSRQDSSRVGVIGSGLEAKTNLEAITHVREIKSVNVFSPTKMNRELFARESSERYRFPVHAVNDPKEAVSGADIVVVATNTTGHADNIAYYGDWMEPGQHINSIGATGGHLREIDPLTFGNANRILVDSYAQVKEESGDSAAALAYGTWDESKFVEMPALFKGVTCRDDDNQITLFKSVGTGVQDIMAAFAVYEQAKQLELGVLVEDFMEHKIF